MYRYKSTRITAANEDEDTRFEDGMSSIKSDFDYLLDTFDKMDRDGNREQAITLMSQVNEFINGIINQAVSEVAE